jgi:hypothetical protein
LPNTRWECDHVTYSSCAKPGRPLRDPMLAWTWTSSLVTLLTDDSLLTPKTAAWNSYQDDDSVRVSLAASCQSGNSVAGNTPPVVYDPILHQFYPKLPSPAAATWGLYLHLLSAQRLCHNHLNGKLVYAVDRFRNKALSATTSARV